MMAGLQNGDVIVEFNKQEVLSMKDYQRILLKMKKGDEVKITANRQNAEGYKKFTCTVEVGVLK